MEHLAQISRRTGAVHTKNRMQCVDTYYSVHWARILSRLRLYSGQSVSCVQLCAMVLSRSETVWSTVLSSVQCTAVWEDGKKRRGCTVLSKIWISVLHCVQCNADRYTVPTVWFSILYSEIATARMRVTTLYRYSMREHTVQYKACVERMWVLRVGWVERGIMLDNC
jgi:hypothetical protein